MKKSIVVIAAFLIGFASFGQKKKDLIKEVARLKAEATEIQARLAEMEKAKELNLEDSLQNFSYAFGVSVGNNLKTVGFDSLSYNAFAIALEDVMKGREKMGLEECQSEVQNTIQLIQEKEAKKQSAEGELFLKENGKRPEVITTESGLQYEVLTKGDGAIPNVKDKVKVHYTGMLINGKVFDSSVERGEPNVFGVTQVIKGWQEALQLMPVGSKWKVFIPQDIAYGQRGAGGGMIPPYAALIFEMELLAIEK
ncbi:FKBP-type peptidyl-prolyl cis-trans isomerase [Maribacter sp. 2308TA10-17]|uniref:FKBP-type peptidyl-prolyl cis-trans isomerase n=1 Tax=Maribacter sp. 2308TA10-17 TaxID=3386276 RepID=UPI0039BCB9B4